MTFVTLCCLALVASVMLVTGGAHLGGFGGFGRQVVRHGLIPGALALPVAALVTGAELATGFAAAIALAGGGGGLLATQAFAVSTGAGAVFLLYLRRLLRAGHTGSCGCSPLASPLTPASFVPAASLVAAGVAGLLASWLSNLTPAAPRAWNALAIGWGIALAALVMLLPASAPGRVMERAS